MASYPPPFYTEPTQVFNTSDWIENTSGIPIDFLDRHYVKFPIAQGAETLQDTTVNGELDVNNGGTTLVVSGSSISSSGGIQFTDATNAAIFYHTPKSNDPATAWENNDLATVGYVQSQLGQSTGGINLYLNQSIASSVAPYKVLSNTATNVATQTVVTTALGTGTLISQFLTPSGYPNIATLQSGVWIFNVFGNRSNTGTGSLIYYAELYSYSNLGVSTLIATSGNSRDVNGTTSAPDCVQVTMSVPTTIISLTDRLLVKLYSTGTGMGGGVTLTTYFEGSYYTYVSTSISIPPPIPTLSQVLTAGNNATNQNITGVSNLTCGTGLTQVALVSSVPQLNLSDGTNTIIIDDSVPSIAISNSLVTTTMGASGFTSTLDTGSTARPLLFTNNSTTGVQALLKSGGITYTPSTSTLTTTNISATTVTANLTGTASTASTITTTSDDTSGTYYIPFSKTSAGTNTTLYVDDSTTALTYDPNLSAIALATVNATQTNTTTTNTNNLIVNSTTQVPTVAYPNNSTSIASTGYVTSAISAIPNLLNTNNVWSGTQTFNNNLQLGPATTNITNLVSAVGGTAYTNINPISTGVSAGYTYYLFPNAGSGFSFSYNALSSQSITFYWVAVGGGGAGSGVAQGFRINAGAGGGGGEVKSGSFTLTSSGTVNITVGAGGTASYTTAGGNGGSTTLSGSASTTCGGGLGGALGTTAGVGGAGGNSATGAVGGVGGTSGSTSGGVGTTVSNSSSGGGGSYYTVVNTFSAGGSALYTFPVDLTTYGNMCNGGYGGGITASGTGYPPLTAGYGSGGAGAICYNDKPSHTGRQPQAGLGGCVLIYFSNATTITPTTSVTLNASPVGNFTNITDSTSSTTGAIVVSGGIGCAKNITSTSYSLGYSSSLPTLTSANIGWFSTTWTEITTAISTTATSQRSISLPTSGTYMISYVHTLQYTGSVATTGTFSTVLNETQNTLASPIAGSYNATGVFAFTVTNARFSNSATVFYTNTTNGTKTIYITGAVGNGISPTSGYVLNTTISSVSFMRIA